MKAKIFGNGSKYLLTIIDRTSRFLDAVPMPKATSENCCKALIEAWISRFGLPDSAVTDNGNTFTTNLWANLHKNLGTIVTYSPIYHPSTMGHIERTHRDINAGLKATLLQI